MVSNGVKWVRIFDIPDVNKHRKGFTIYKIISMLYPESCPDAITKVTVWKRFNDFKRLHREIKAVQKKLGIKDKIPTLPGKTFFKRFDDDIIQERRQSILNFLEYVALHHQLFTSNEFVKFFESSHTPVDQLNSNINLIRAELNLPEELQYLNTNSDDDHTISDTDSVTTLNSLSLSLQASDMPDSQNATSKLSLTASTVTSHHSKCSDTASISSTIDSFLMLDSQMYPTPPNTPGCVENWEQYIIDASIHVSMALELEQARKYEEAFTAYNTAADILMRYGLDDKNVERQKMVRYKSGKYLIRAEKIYNMHLASEVKNLKEISEVQEDDREHVIQRPISDLYKYKVVKIIGSGMLVLHSELQQLFYIKVIHKTMTFLNDNLVLPENVPYMVRLYNYYNCENALFLVLEYCSGTKLWDYVKFCSETSSDARSKSDSGLLKKVQEFELSDAESDHSYADLINEYARNKSTTGPGLKSGGGGAATATTTIAAENDLSSDDSYEKVTLDDCVNPNRNLMPMTSCLEDLLSKSGRPVCQIDGAKTEEGQGAAARGNSANKALYQRSLSEMSSFDDVDVAQNFVIPCKNVVKWSAQLLVALEKLHTLGVICGDLQSENLLITEEGDLVLTYMCNANELCDVFTNGKSFHLAPEIYGFQPITDCVDWWCFGAILYELLVGLPLSMIYPDGLASHTNLKIPKYVSPEGRSLLKQLLTFEPRDRLGSGANGTENIKSHPFFSTICWSDLLAKCNV